MKSKFFWDLLACLLAAYFITTHLDYYYISTVYELDMWVYIPLYILLFVFCLLGLLQIRRKNRAKHPTAISKTLDALFPLFIIAFLSFLIGVSFYLTSNLGDENIGQKIMDLIDNDFSRLLIDLYAVPVAGLVLKPLGMLLMLFCTYISRYLAAFYRKSI